MGMIDKILDRWSGFDYKATYENERLAPFIQPAWLDETNSRRLRAYSVLESYSTNVSREWLQRELNDQKGDRREYGDPGLLVDMALSSLLGDRVRIVTENAIGEVEDAALQAAALAQHEILLQWIDREQFYTKQIESERQSVKLGDSIYILGWDDKKRRPRLNVYDPGFYFPVFEDMMAGSEDYPTTVHIMYEFDTKKDDEDITYLRKITWSLQPAIEMDGYDPPYDNGGEMAFARLMYSDGVWDLDSTTEEIGVMKGVPVFWNVEPLLMDMDFIPIIHVPNTVALQEHFGQSVLERVMQILDDIQATDTDLQRAASTTGSPPIVMEGIAPSGDQQAVGPGQILYTGGGKASILDTSRALDALLALKDALLERLSTNSRTPESLLGRVKPNEVPSGIALTLSFTPHASLVKEMRLVRKNKYDLLFKFVMRMLQFGGEVPKGPIEKTHLVFGSFLPSDKQEAMQLVVQLLTAKAISLETAVQILIEAGIPIEDWVEEIKRIQFRDVETAQQLTAMTMDANVGLEYMGRPPIEDGDLRELPPDEDEEEPVA